MQQTCHCPHCSPLLPPGEVTESGRRYFEENSRTLGFMHFVIQAALRTDYVKVVATEALAGRPIPADKTFVDLATEPPGPATQSLRRNSQVLLQMIFCRLVENFETYLSEVLREALKAKPEMMRARDEVRLDYVLRFATLGEMLDDLVDRKVSELAYLGIAKLDDWVAERMSIRLLEDTPAVQVIVEAVETRNCIVHSRGRVGEKYVKNVETPKFALGETRQLEVDDVYDASAGFVKAVSRFDVMIAEKYSLKRERELASAGFHQPLGCACCS
jgi:hypothetical protein